MEMQEMIVRLLTGQVKAYREQMLAEMKADRKADQEKAEANRINIKEMIKATQDDIKSNQAEMRSTVDVWMPDIKDARKNARYKGCPKKCQI
jgi:3-mercaptopyruvate sulfurtransferase SseA